MRVGGLQRHRSGMVLGTFFALLHVLWALIAVAGFSAEVANFFFRTHFIVLQHATFRPDMSWFIAGVVTAFATGYITGTLLAYMWNRSYNYF